MNSPSAGSHEQFYTPKKLLELHDPCLGGDFLHRKWSFQRVCQVSQRLKAYVSPRRMDLKPALKCTWPKSMSPDLLISHGAPGVCVQACRGSRYHAHVFVAPNRLERRRELRSQVLRLRFSCYSCPRNAPRPSLHCFATEGPFAFLLDPDVEAAGRFIAIAAGRREPSSSANASQQAPTEASKS